MRNALPTSISYESLTILPLHSTPSSKPALRIRSPLFTRHDATTDNHSNVFDSLVAHVRGSFRLTLIAHSENSYHGLERARCEVLRPVNVSLRWVGTTQARAGQSWCNNIAINLEHRGSAYFHTLQKSATFASPSTHHVVSVHVYTCDIVTWSASTLVAQVLW